MKYFVILALLIAGLAGVLAPNSLYADITENEENFTKFDFTVENRDSKLYNDYVDAYNIITENIPILIKEYKKKCGLAEKPNYNDISLTYTLNDGDVETFYQVIGRPLYYNAETKYLPLYDSYKDLNEATESLCYYFEKSRTYYNRNKSAVIDIRENERIHELFMKSLELFKTRYEVFAEDIKNFTDEQKYEDSVLLIDLSLDIHEMMNKSILVISDAESILNRHLKQRITPSAKEKYMINVDTLKGQYERLSAITDDELLAYGFGADDKELLDLFIKRLKGLIGIMDRDVNIYFSGEYNGFFPDSNNFLYTCGLYYDDLVKLFNELTL